MKELNVKGSLNVEEQLVIDRFGNRLLRESQIFHRCDTRVNSIIYLKDYNKELYRITKNWGMIVKIEHWTGVKWWIWKEKK